MTYEDYLKMVTRGNELTNNSYEVYSEEKFKRFQEIERKSERYNY